MNTGPLIAVLSINDASTSLTTKILLASLRRSMTDFVTTVFHNRPIAIANLPKVNTTEVSVPEIEGSVEKWPYPLASYLEPTPRQWVIIMDCSSVVLRPIDHLIPTDASEQFPAPEVDFYWTRAKGGSASTGVWAVRGEYLAAVSENWNVILSEHHMLARDNEMFETEATDCEETLWTKFVGNLPLRKKSFEIGEIYAPKTGAIDWSAINSAALVTIPDWAEKDKWTFMQALYFSKYFGDSTGLFLGILDP